ncbi:unnamed protein product [Nippostrongylus brasiliensis]|uniref:MADF domain-containing protein n=1 Tax=Nippostrongylus brasiliensis TaxID=27835 RepID=A0A0N4XIX7_NIPBR|nr:unnamed protein product [Nippostrongylus brasiliensis]
MKRNKPDPERTDVLTEVEKTVLAELVRERPSLWDDSLESYKNSYERGCAWRAIAVEMEIEFSKPFEVTSLQRIFKNLRDVYVRKRRELRTHIAMCSGSDNAATFREKIERWPYFKALDFLGPCVDSSERYATYCTFRPASEDPQDPVDDIDRATPEVEFKKCKNEPDMEELLEADKLFLIDAVALRHELWDKSLKEYKDRGVRANAWSGVKQDMELQTGKIFTVDDLQRIFKNLRDVYIRKKRDLKTRIAKCSTTLEEDRLWRRADEWPYWKALQFLDMNDGRGRRNVAVWKNDENVSSGLFETSASDAGSVDTASTTSDSSKKAEQSQKNDEPRQLLESIANALKQDGKCDAFDITCMNMAHSLRSIAEYDELRALEWKIRLDELQLQIANDELRIRGASQ